MIGYAINFPWNLRLQNKEIPNQGVSLLENGYVVEGIVKGADALHNQFVQQSNSAQQISLIKEHLLGR